MKSYNYSIDGLDCAMCAQSLQKRLQTLDWVESAVVNFTLSKISIATERQDDIFEDLKNFVYQIEPQSTLSKIDEFNSEKNKQSFFKDWFIWCFLSGAFVGIIGIIIDKFTTNKILSIVLICISAILMLIKTAQRAFAKAVKGHTIDENLLVSISVIGAIAIGSGMEGLMVIFLYQIGKFLEAKAVAKTRKDLDSLLKVKPTFVRLKTKNSIVEVSPSTVFVGSTIVVYAGDIVALDGVVQTGSASLNMSSLTGESSPVAINEGDSIMSGAINLDGVLTIKTTSTDTDSTITKIMNLVETAAERKAKAETIVSRAARYYTPIVIFLAIFVGLMFGFFSNIGIKESIYRGMIFLVISCPCAIAISVPLSYFSGIGNASKKGILVKGSNYLDAVANLKTVVFDKTGTLTTGEFNVSEIIVLDNKFSKEEIIEMAATGEKNSTHPIAKAIVSHYIENYNTSDFPIEVSSNVPAQVNEIAGRGIMFKYDGKNIFIGRGKSESKSTIVNVEIENIIAGQILLNDKIKENSKKTISYLDEKNIQSYMFTGDNQAVANSVADEIGIKNVEAQMLPMDKFTMLEKIIVNKNKNEICAFVGDGINDAPVLTRADIGIAMGLSGSTATIDTADIVIMNDDINQIETLHKLAKFTRLIVKENLIFALGVKLIFMILGTLGITGMAWAVVADVGLTLCTIFNSIRVLKYK